MNITEKLKRGDMRTTGKSDEVVKEVLKNTQLFIEVFEGMLSDDAEKIANQEPELLNPFKKILIDKVSKIEQQEVQWHVRQLFSYLDNLNNAEREKIIGILYKYVETTKSNIVKVFSMQALSDLAEKESSLKPKIVSKIKEMMKSGVPSINSRGKKLLKKLEK